MDNLETRARTYATSSHARINHLRKYSLQPYDVHLLAVARLVASVIEDQEMIAAAWLHDTVEDTPATFDDIEREFGPEVMTLVKELTDISKPSDGNRSIRKQIDRQHIAAASPRAKTIKLADLIDNCEDICRHDPKFGLVYLHEMQSLMHVLADGNRFLYEKALKVINRCGKKLGINNHDIAVENEPWKRIRASEGQHGIRLFIEAFAARDIMEPLLSYDNYALQETNLPSLKQVGAVAGVRTDGIVSGYLTSEDMTSGDIPKIRQIDPQQFATLDTPLTDIIHTLTHFMHCFIGFNGVVIGVIGRGDIEKPVVRMWLFGIIILIEMQIVNLIRTHWPDGEWDKYVSNGRLEKAVQLRDERIRREQNADLLDCLQFSDKLQIVLHQPEFIRNAGFSSQSAAKKSMKDLESLRNNLAHGQGITRHDWPPIVRLAQRIQEIYRF